MRVVIWLLVVFVGGIVVTMGTCEAVFRLGIQSGEVFCGHNAGFQILLYWIIGIGIVIALLIRRHNRGQPPNKS